MSDASSISGANAHHSESILSKIRADFGKEPSSRSPHFCGVVKQRSKRCRMSMRTTFGLTRYGPLRDTTGPSRINTVGSIVS